MLLIDEAKVFREIEARKPKATRIVFNAPDGLLPKLQALALKVEERYGVQAIIIADPSYGSCDTVDMDSEVLGADISFHIGHKISLERIGKKTLFVDAIDDASFTLVLETALPILKKHKIVGLCTISQHLHRLSETKDLLEKNGVEVVLGRGKGHLLDGQVFGCEFYPIFDIRDRVEAFAFLGQSSFHALGVALSSGKPTYMLDPYFNEVSEVTRLAEERLKRAVLGVYKALDAKNIGLIIGLKEGQMSLLRALDLKEKLERFEKKVSLVALREITNERLEIFKDIDAFVQTSCPRISLDGYTFSKPNLSVPQALALIRLLEGKEMGPLLEQRNWL